MPSGLRKGAARKPIKKTHAWITDVGGVSRKGWLEVLEDKGDARPADPGWRRMAVFPKGSGATKVHLWADDVDKYIARIDVGNDQRWVVMEGLPALLATAESLNALVQLGMTGSK